MKCHNFYHGWHRVDSKYYDKELLTECRPLHRLSLQFVNITSDNLPSCSNIFCLISVSLYLLPFLNTKSFLLRTNICGLLPAISCWKVKFRPLSGILASWTSITQSVSIKAFLICRRPLIICPGNHWMFLLSPLNENDCLKAIFAILKFITALDGSRIKQIPHNFHFYLFPIFHVCLFWSRFK